jgi:hypothetical protein
MHSAATHEDGAVCLYLSPWQALVDLYFFKEVNPDQDIEAMLSSASATFKNFILRGLYKVSYQ